MKTYMANPAKVEKKWYVVDAEGQTLGRLASEVAKVLRGKNKPEFTPFVDILIGSVRRKSQWLRQSFMEQVEERAVLPEYI